MCKAASGGTTRICNRSLWLRETLSCHRRGSRATDRRSDHYRPISIISPPFSLEFGLRCPQHLWRRRGSGRPPWCWGNTFGARFSLLTPWHTMLVSWTSSSATRSTELFTGVHVGFALGTNGREKDNRYCTPTPYPHHCTRQRKVYIADEHKQRYEEAYDSDLDHHYNLYLRPCSYLWKLQSYPY